MYHRLYNCICSIAIMHLEIINPQRKATAKKILLGVVYFYFILLYYIYVI